MACKLAWSAYLCLSNMDTRVNCFASSLDAQGTRSRLYTKSGQEKMAFQIIFACVMDSAFNKNPPKFHNRMSSLEGIQLVHCGTMHSYAPIDTS